MPTIVLFLAKHGGIALWKVAVAITAAAVSTAGAEYYAGKNKK